MKARINFVPAFCPNCGHDLDLDALTRVDFYEGAILLCPRCKSTELEYEEDLQETNANE